MKTGLGEENAQILVKEDERRASGISERTKVERLDLPILVQWEWKEKTKTFLVIFHFYDDYSKPNMRSERTRFLRGKPPINPYVYFYVTEEEFSKAVYPQRFYPSKHRAVITWAPSHIELGLLQELLSYANIINGFKESVKLDLIKKLMFFDMPTETTSKSKKDMSEKIHAYGYRIKKQSGEETMIGCTELCIEYIEHLRETLKPYL
jgi:hypothetical protein